MIGALRVKGEQKVKSVWNCCLIGMLREWLFDIHGMPQGDEGEKISLSLDYAMA